MLLIAAGNRVRTPERGDSASCTGCMRRSPALQVDMKDPRYRKSPDQADEGTKKDVLRITDGPVAQAPLTVFSKTYSYEMCYRKLSQAKEPKSPNTRAVHCLWRWLVRKR